MFRKNLFPDAEHAVEIAGDPRFERVHVGALARRRMGAVRARGPRGLHGPRHARLVVGEHGEVTLEALRQRELRIGGERALEVLGRVDLVLEIGEHRAIVRRARLGRGRDRQSVQIVRHGFTFAAIAKSSAQSQSSGSRGEQAA